MITFEGQNFEMLGLFMHSEIDLLGEAGWALVTFVGFFWGVDSYMIEKFAHALLCVVASFMLALKQLEQSRLIELF